jgi:fructosamine-3-kinase
VTSPASSSERVAIEVAEALNAEVVSQQPVAGGDVAAAFRLHLDDGRTVFAKTRAGASPDFFNTEAAGLGWLREANALSVPLVLHVGHTHPLLVLEWVHEGRGTASTDAEFGTALAHLHRAGATTFGREDRRTTGSRGLPNEPAETWAEFLATNRLLPLARMASDANALPATAVEAMDAIAQRLPEFGATHEAPARLHGDLWAGNRIIDTNGTNWLIDPACHGGHREFDLAMMRLFGGWDPAAFAAYDDVWPLSAGWQERIALHQLAPLAVHAIKFGGTYVAAVEAAIDSLLWL